MRRHVNIYALRIPKVVMDIFKDVKKDCLTSGKKKVCRLFRHTSQSMYVQGFSSIHRNKTSFKQRTFFCSRTENETNHCIPYSSRFSGPLRTQCMYVLFLLITYNVFVCKNSRIYLTNLDELEARQSCRVQWDILFKK